MFGGMLQASTKALGGARFTLVNLLPTTLFVTSVALVIASGAYAGRQPDLRPVFDELKDSPGLAVGAVFGIFLISVLLRPFQVALVQVLEGYWQRWPALALADDLATERHRRLLNTAYVKHYARESDRPVTSEFSDVADYARRHRSFNKKQRRATLIVDTYPRPSNGDDRLMPTLLGNVLRDGEDNAGQRYGLDMPVVYPRMYPSLSPKLDSIISAQLDMLDTAAALCIAFALTALFSAPLVAHVGWWSLVPLVAALASALAYRGAIAIARGHGTFLATAFDLHRFDMLTALHYELPATPEEELAFNATLSSFLAGRSNAAVVMQDISYRHLANSATQDAQPPMSGGATQDQSSDG